MNLFDGLFINPLIGREKSGDFKDELIMKAYETLIDSYYPKESVMLATMHTRMRYAGPKEAILQAIICKNFGCSHFIVGRDHTGVKSYYEKDASIRIFDRVDTGLNIVHFDTALFCLECGEITISCKHNIKEKKVGVAGLKSIC